MGRVTGINILCAMLYATIGCTTAGAPVGDDGPLGSKADGSDAAEPVCQNPAFQDDQVLMNYLGVRDPIEVVTNFTSWPEYRPGEASVQVPQDVIDTEGLSPEAARERLAAAFPGCEDAVKEHLATQDPNVYIYFAGYGGPQQNNATTHSPAILNWINRHDPEALIFAINWNCDAEDSDSFCHENAREMTLKEGDPAYDRMRAVFANAPAGALPGDPNEIFQQAAPQFSGEGTAGFGYDSAMSHSIHLAARLVDQLLVSGDVGDIHFVGYSMGAQSAARVLSQDFVGDGTGYKWSAEGVCESGGSACTVAQLSKVRWSFSMGLPGWSEAMQTYREFGDGSPEFRAQYGNGGLLRVSGGQYNNKLNVLNRRMDPTSDSEDTLVRFLGDIAYGEYNHYSHDYAHPLFIQPAFVSLIGDFLRADAPNDILEAGILFDNAGYVTFNDCGEGLCNASTNYYAHAQNRAHGDVDIPRLQNIATTDGVGNSGRAVSFREGGSVPFVMNTFDQEDLRGSVEMYFRPSFDAAMDTEVHGLFSYGSCNTAGSDLMPEAYFADGKLVFALSYQGERFETSVDASALNSEEWAHLAFSWNLPAPSMTHEQVDPNGFAEHQLAFGIAQGLMRPLRTTYRRQMGQGSLKIHVNGNEAASAPLGSADSQRGCLPVDQVLVGASYDVNGRTYSEYLPYAGYTREGGNIAQVQPGQPLGTLCKAYRVPNAEVFFGCAQSAGEANAAGDMDEVAIIWGPGRELFENVGTHGQPVAWPVGGMPSEPNQPVGPGEVPVEPALDACDAFGADNSFVDAIPLTDEVGAEVCMDDDDYYLIEGGGEVLVTFEHEQGDLDLHAMTPDGTLLSVSQGLGNTETLSHDETFVVRVFGYNSAVNSYSIKRQ